MIGIIAAVSQNGVIGKNNSLPFNYKEDMKWFRSTTSNKEFPPTVIMGKNTFISMGSRKLPGRRNMVITKSTIEGVETRSSIANVMEELAQSNADIWFIGGTNIYREGMKYADTIYLTLIPEIVEGDDLAYFPWVDPGKFNVEAYIPLYNDNGDVSLNVAKYVRMNK